MPLGHFVNSVAMLQSGFTMSNDNYRQVPFRRPISSTISFSVSASRALVDSSITRYSVRDKRLEQGQFFGADRRKVCAFLP